MYSTFSVIGGHVDLWLVWPKHAQNSFALPESSVLNLFLKYLISLIPDSKARGLMEEMTDRCAVVAL